VIVESLEGAILASLVWEMDARWEWGYGGVYLG
jgi:hypothetical protein